jgi:L-cysteine/cystine lyase
MLKSLGWKSGSQRYEIATSAYPLYAGLRSAIALQHEWGTIEERYAEICRLSKYLWERLSELPDVECLRKSAPEAGLVSFRLTNGMPHKKLVDLLEKQGIMVRTILNPDCVRACVHYYQDFIIWKRSFHLSKTLASAVIHFQQATARFLLGCVRNSSQPLANLEG